MKPAPFTYHRTTGLAETTALLADLEDVRLLAGGQSLMPMLNMRYVMVDHIVDLNDVTELAGIRIEGDRVTVGAMTRQRDVLNDAALRSRAPVVAEALQLVGHLQTRNRGTVGGSLAHLDPAAELAGLAALHDATIRLARQGGERSVPMDEFALGFMTPCIEPGEVLTGITFDLWPEGHGHDFREFARRHGDFAIVGVGTLMTLNGGGRIDRAACVLIGVDFAPVRLPEVEAMLVGEAPSEALFRAAGAAAAGREMMEDALVPETYRKQLAAVLLRRSLASAAARIKGGNHG